MVEVYFEDYEDMVEVMLVLEIFLRVDCWVENLLCGAPFCFEACLFSFTMIFSACGSNLFSMIFNMALLRWLMRLIAR